MAQETITIGNEIWMKQNLNIGTMIPMNQFQANNNVIEKWCYNNLESNCEIYGAFYQWNELMKYVQTEGTKGICPDGFHIPTYSEWLELINYCGGKDSAGVALKEVGYNHWQMVMFWKPADNDNSYYNQSGNQWMRPTNSSGFTAMGGGYVNPSRNGWLKQNAFFWTSSKVVGDYFVTASQPDPILRPVMIYMNYKFPTVSPNTQFEFSGANIRCIKNLNK